MPLRHKVTEVQLRNGARGLLIDVPDMTVVSYDFSFRAGNDYARRPEIQQVAHLVEHLAFGANALYDSAETFSQVFNKNGASSNATTWDTSILYYGISPVMEWDRILDLWQLSITQPVFTEQALTTEKSNVHEELQGQLSNRGRILWQQTNRASGSKSFLDAEKITTIDAITLDDIQEHYTRTHTLANLRFVIAGDIVTHQAAICEKMESWQLQQGKRLNVVQATARKGKLVHLYRDDMPNVSFRFVMCLTRELTSHEQDTIGALNHILCGTFHSRIYGKARSRGICYGMGSDASSGKDGVSEWEFYGEVSPKNAASLFELIVEQVVSVVNGHMSEEELVEAKSYALGSIQLRGQTVGALSDEYGDDFFSDDPIELLVDAPKSIKAVTVEGMTQLAREFLTAGLWTFGEIGTIERQETAQHEQIFAQLFKTS